MFDAFFSFKAEVLVYFKKSVLYVHINTNLVFYWLKYMLLRVSLRMLLRVSLGYSQVVVVIKNLPASTGTLKR